MEFADIALAKFLQTAPELAPYIANFSEVSDELGDSGADVKVGVFIIKSGAGLAYAPVISKGDTVFPIDSIFLESEGIFRPISQSTTNYLLNSSPEALGKATKIPNTVEKNPSLFNIINPPRTGKFVYASASRLPEFLAVVPQPVRKFVFEKIAEEKSVYDSLDKLFGLKAIFSVLESKVENKGNTNSVASGPELSKSQSYSVITTPQEVRALLSDAASKTFLEQGYVIQGEGSTFRSAVSFSPYEKLGQYIEIHPASDGGKDYRVVFNDGTTRDGIVPKYHILNPLMKDSLAILYADGTFSRGRAVALATPIVRENTLKVLMDLNPPKLLKELNRDEKFMIFLASGEALGPFSADSVTRTNLGVEVKVYAGNIKRICGYNNFSKDVESIGDTLFVQHNVVVVALGNDDTSQLERSVNFAADKRELAAAQFLGTEMNLRFDGVEFSSDDKVLGKFASAMKFLVEKEQLEPVVAENFLKQAQEISYVKLFLSKTAASTDFRPTEIPQYGNPTDPIQDVGLNGSFMPALQASTAMNDPQVIESTIISQLLQVPDLFEYIQEYLPDLEQTVDRLGRILFVTRLKIDQISNSLDSDSVFALISQIKTIYRQLGDVVIKLKGISSASLNYNQAQDAGTVKK